ncbi:MAG: lipoprotein [Proteobacteria bacterium]|nr:lipoprotein [Pseudomonadota bacterium]
MRTAALVMTCLLLAACGQKGPLYLPEDQRPPETAMGEENSGGAEPSPGPPLAQSPGKQ